jgi:hypothetical protein
VNGLEKKKKKREENEKIYISEKKIILEFVREKKSIRREPNLAIGESARGSSMSSYTHI